MEPVETWGKSSWGIPTPSSRTMSCADFPVSLSVTRTGPPSGLYLTALVRIVGEDTMRATLVNRYDDTRRPNLEHKMVEVGHELLFEHSLARERDQLSPGQQ